MRCSSAIASWMDDPASSRRRRRDVVPSSERNVRRRCPIPELVASRRQRREEAAAATLAARVGAVSGRNVRPRLSIPSNLLPATDSVVLASASVAVAPRRYVVPSELNSKLFYFKKL